MARSEARGWESRHHEGLRLDTGRLPSNMRMHLTNGPERWWPPIGILGHQLPAFRLDGKLLVAFGAWRITAPSTPAP